MMQRIVCSIVIVNWNSIDYLVESIRSIRLNTRLSHEIIIIDNDSCQSDKLRLRELDDIILIENNSNVGFAAANNQGIAIARGEFIFLLNPDTKLLNNAIDLLVSFLEENQQVSAVGPKLFFSENLDYHPSIKSLDSPFSNVFFLIPGSLWLKKFYQFFISKLENPRKVACLIGAAVLFRKTVFDEVGTLDEEFFIYSEEVDLFMRMKKAGLVTTYLPASRIIHYGGKSQEKVALKKLEYLWTSKFIYFKKHYSRFNNVVNLWLLLLIVIIKVHIFRRQDILPLSKLIYTRIFNGD